MEDGYNLMKLSIKIIDSSCKQQLGKLREQALYKDIEKLINHNRF